MSQDNASLPNMPMNFPGLEAFYRGKVRDVYKLGPWVVLVSTDRVSAFDQILPHPIPHKGQIINQLSAFFLEQTAGLVPNWLRSVPDPCASIGLRCEPFKVEFIVRGYLLGHAWRMYREGCRELSGAVFPEGLQAYDPLPSPLLTPSTKAVQDVDISREGILRRGLMDAAAYDEVARHAFALYGAGVAHARTRGLILADAKYEFGVFDKKIYLIDELHTLDSARYFDAKVYQEKRRQGEAVPHLSKELLRQWLFQAGKEGFVWDEEHIRMLSDMYTALYTRLTGQSFVVSVHAEGSTCMQARIQRALQNIAAL